MKQCTEMQWRGKSSKKQPKEMEATFNTCPTQIQLTGAYNHLKIINDAHMSYKWT